MWASNGAIFVTPCGVNLRVFIIRAMSEANLNGELFLSIRMTPYLRFGVCIRRSTTPMDLSLSSGANRS